MKSLHFFLPFTFLFLSSLSIAQQSKTDSLLKLIKTDKEDTNKVDHLVQLIDACQYEGKFDDGLNYGKTALQLSEKLNFKNGIANVHDGIGNMYWNQGNYDKALENHFVSLKIRKERKDKYGISSSYNNIGNIYVSQGNYSKALENHFASLKISEELRDKRSLAFSYNNIGVIYWKQEKYDKALENYLASLKIKKELGNKQSCGRSYNNIGIIYKLQGNYSKALENYLASLEISEEFGDKPGIASCYNNIALIYYQQKNYDKALENYFASLKIREEIGDKKGIALVRNNIGALYLQQGKTEDSKKQSLASLIIAKEIGSKENIKDAYKLLSTGDSTAGNWKGAYTYHQMYIVYRDSIDNEETRKKTVETEMTYAFEKKEAAAKAEQDKKDAVAAEEKQKEKTVRYSVIGGLLLVLMVLVIVFRSLKITRKQKVVIEQQKHLVEESRKEIVDSINYAKRIQMALLASKDLLDRNLPPHFVFFNPKDIVSGDFYWATEHDNKFYLAICDSTGHGVPGAFMSLLNIGFLSEAIKEKDILEPHEVFNYVRQRLITSIGNEGQQDGMDAVLICMDKNKQRITYAAANNEPVLIRNNEIIILPKDKMPVGKGERNESFALHNIELQKGDVLYVYTDGYADQFGGTKGKKFKYKQLNELLISIHKENPQQQKEKLYQHFLSWKGNLEQVDDVCLIGIMNN